MRAKLLLRFAVVCLLSAATVSPAVAQSEYHWSDQFGNKSTLLNGTVIGGVSDLGAVFYNPGRLTQLERTGFLLTAEAFELNQVEVHVGQGDTNEVEQASLRGAPSLVAGMFTLPSLPGHKFAYSFLTRRRSESDLLFSTEVQGDWFPTIPSEELYLGSWESVSKLDENWIGLSWAHELSSRLSVGVSTFGTYTGRKRRVELDIQALASTGEASAHSRFREYRFTSFGLLWKGGIAADFAPFRVGLSITTPEITAFGSGSIRYKDVLFPPEPSLGDPAEDRIVVAREQGLKVNFRSPFSLGAGLTWVNPRAEIHLSGEWYSGVAPYQIMGADSIRGQSSGEYLEYQVVEELKSVFNFGVGVEWLVGDAFSAYGSIVRDASAASENPTGPFEFGDRVSNSVSQADGFYLGAGVSLETTWIDLTAGFSFGSMEERQENPLTSGSAGLGQSVFEPPALGVTTRRWRFLIGFTIPLVEAVVEEPSSR